MSRSPRHVWILLALAASPLSCSKHHERRPASSSRLNAVLTADVRSFDPADAYSTQLVYVSAYIYESLYQYDYFSEPPAVQPLLATGLPRASADRTTVRISIRKGVHFADDPCFKETMGKGREVTAEDFVYSLKRLAIPKLNSGGWWIVDGKIRGMHELHERMLKASPAEISPMLEEPIEGIRAVDRYTIEIRLTRPCPQLAGLFTLGPTAVLPHEAVQKYGDADGHILDHPVGSGPYVLAFHAPRQEILLSRNVNYRDDFYPNRPSAVFGDQEYQADEGKRLPLLEELDFKIYDEEWSNWLEFMKGNADFIEIPKDAFSQVIQAGNDLSLTPEMRAKGIRLSVVDSVTMMYVEINMKDPLLGKNKLLRQALSSAVDRDAWSRYFYEGTATTMTSILPPGVEGRPAQPRLKYGYDLARAKELLAQAGYPGGRGLPPIDIMMGTPDTSTRQLGEFFVRELAKIGVSVVPSFDAPGHREQRKLAGDYQLVYGGWGMDYLDPENNYMLLYGKNFPPGPNDSRYENPDYDALFDKMAIEQPGPARDAMILGLEDIAQEDVPWIMGVYPRWHRLTQPWVRNYRYHDLIFNADKYRNVAPH